MKPQKRSRDYSDGGPRKRKLDPIVANKIDFIDYKDVNLLRKFITENGKVLPRRITGCNAKNQRAITLAIKRARALGILPFTGSI
ncbi:MAG: 30S ribosomal protein S18 [Candidatus Obscuribacterales bacterium]|nr:30S ribosomal protein S18 [Candidatus Obscuribacterales bacterium]